MSSFLLLSGRVWTPTAAAVLLSTALAACTMPKRAPVADEWQEVSDRSVEVLAPAAPPRLDIVGRDRPSPEVAVASRGPSPVAIAVTAKPLARPPPAYPATLIEASLEGRVIASFVVDEAGRVASVDIERATHPAFAESVRSALARWRFEPARSAAGEAVRSTVRVPFQFRLE